MIRASSLDRLLECNGSLVLPNDAPRSQTSIEAAEYGTAAHAYVENIEDYLQDVTHPKLARKLSMSPDSEHQLRALYTLPGHPTREGHYAYGAGGALRYVGEGWDDFRAAFPGITGTCDYVVDDGTELFVDDLKTGRFPPNPRSWQIRFYALCAWLIAGKPAVTTVSVTHWPFYPLAGVPKRKRSVLNHADHAETQRRLDELIARPTEFVVGTHCKFCPARTNCEAYNRSEKIDDEGNSW